jgi:hypothetical protein
LTLFLAAFLLACPCPQCLTYQWTGYVSITLNKDRSFPYMSSMTSDKH